jgi:pyocin large subunit-like protein
MGFSTHITKGDRYVEEYNSSFYGFVNNAKRGTGIPFV